MRRSLLWALLPVAGLAWGLTTPAARAAPPPGTLVAVVDVPALMSAHPAYARANEAFKAEAKRIIAEQDAGQEDIKKKVKEVEIDTNRDSPQYVEKVRSIERMKVTAEFDFKWKQRVAIDEQLRAWAAVYEQVKSDLAEYARSKGIAVVLQMTQERLQASSREDFASNLLVRAVPYFEPALDITADVVALIKAKHPAGPAPAPAPGPMPPGPAPAPAPMPPGPAPAPGPAMGR